MILSPDGHIWLKNINEKSRQMRVLLDTYEGHEIGRAKDHLMHVELWAKNFMEAFELKAQGGLYGKVNIHEAEEAPKE